MSSQNQQGVKHLLDMIIYFLRSIFSVNIIIIWIVWLHIVYITSYIMEDIKWKTNKPIKLEEIALFEKRSSGSSSFVTLIGRRYTYFELT